MVFVGEMSRRWRGEDINKRKEEEECWIQQIPEIQETELNLREK